MKAAWMIRSSFREGRLQKVEQNRQLLHARKFSILIYIDASCPLS